MEHPYWTELHSLRGHPMASSRHLRRECVFNREIVNAFRWLIESSTPSGFLKLNLSLIAFFGEGHDGVSKHRKLGMGRTKR